MTMKPALWLALLSTCSLGAAQTEPRLKPDFSNVVNWSRAKVVLKLSPAHLKALRTNQFFVSPGGYEEPSAVYGTNDYANFSSLITSDNVLQVFHQFYDSTLRHVEQNHLASEAKKLTVAMLKQTTKRYRSLAGSPLASAALKNVAYFGVADRLLGGREPIVPSAKGMVSRELALIAADKGADPGAIFPYPIDYSQFIVRGHYTKTKLLGRYFQAMMWYGLIPIALEQRMGQGVFPLGEQVRQAALMVQDLYDCGAAPSWQRIYDATSLYVGDSNDMTAAVWRAAVKPVLGWPQNLSSLSNGETVKSVIAAVKAAFHAKIVSKAVGPALAGDTQFRFMGQRSIPDSVAFNALTVTPFRPWPDPLDVAAVFGSPRAAAILDADPSTYNPNGWSDYRYIRNSMTKQIAAWGPSDWNRNLYNGSLDLIRLNLAKPAANAPRFMQSDAWAVKSIYSSLAYWAYLRHDTILYGEQTVASEGGDGDEPQPYVKGYVEPNVPFYQEALIVIDAMERGLKRFGYLSNNGDSQAGQFKDFRDTVSFLLSVSERELAGKKLSKDEHGKIRKIGDDFGSLNYSIQMSGDRYIQMTPDDYDMAEIADVHTVDSEAMEVGVGHADDLIAIVPIEGQLYAARGSVLSFYQFKVPVSQRMTDHQWKQSVNEKTPRPAWIKSFFVNQDSQGKDR